MGKPIPETREQPKSLQALEQILIFLTQSGLCSIRKISEGTNSSNRVVKNALFSLETLGQVKRVIKEGKILPEWEITKDGIKVANRLKLQEVKTSPGKEEVGRGEGEVLELLQNPAILKSDEKLATKLKELQNNVLFQINAVSSSVQRVISLLFENNHLTLQDLFGDLLREVKSTRRNLEIPLPKKPLPRVDASKTEIKAAGEANHQKYVNLYVITALLDHYAPMTAKLANEIIQETLAGNLDTVTDLFDHASNLLNLLLALSQHYYHLGTQPGGEIGLSSATIEAIVAGKPPSVRELLDAIVPTVTREDPEKPSLGKLKEAILHYFEQLRAKVENHVNPTTVLLSAFYRGLRNFFPDLRFDIETMEDVLDQLSAKQYLPEIIQKGEGLKYLPLKQFTTTEIEDKILAHAKDKDSFTLGEIAAELSLSPDELKESLVKLTGDGVLRYNTSYREGERWYLVR